MPNMKKVKTADLTALQLDWAVAKCKVAEPVGSFLDGVVPHTDYNNFHPSTAWDQGVPLIERESIRIQRGNDLVFPRGNEHGEFAEPLWLASIDNGAVFHGQTPLIAAMRCYCYAKLGEFVDIPEDLK